ncbi:hypothetical protein COY95_02945 [Candidatus Woesearchaeota archaeon CG_4_10_14_0_8_um_filter_47_5]|nr:MAG: hypothetical protein COY95_02945 [Candidatus Woesearchaeota archaeon CG_4_10_14_0_8_um_filter_47_5]
MYVFDFYVFHGISRAFRKRCSAVTSVHHHDQRVFTSSLHAIRKVPALKKMWICRGKFKGRRKGKEIQKEGIREIKSSP